MHPHFQFDAKAMKTWSAGPRAHQHEKGIRVGLRLDTLVRVRIHARADSCRALVSQRTNEMGDGRGETSSRTV
jgi:hypothetical protein